MSFKLTDAGEDQATNPSRKPGLESKAIAFMYMVGKPIELEEIMDEVRLSDEKTVELITRMKNEGFVEEV